MIITHDAERCPNDADTFEWCWHVWIVLTRSNSLNKFGYFGQVLIFLTSLDCSDKFRFLWQPTLKKSRIQKTVWNLFKEYFQFLRLRVGCHTYQVAIKDVLKIKNLTPLTLRRISTRRNHRRIRWRNLLSMRTFVCFDFTSEIRRIFSSRKSRNDSYF